MQTRLSDHVKLENVS